MNGVKFLLDTCLIIRWRKQDEQVFRLSEQFGVQSFECAYSDISHAEVFGWNGISQDEEFYLTNLLMGIPRLAITNPILDYTIAIRKQYKIKLPDALILATAKTHGLILLTLDEKLNKIYQAIQ